MTKASRVASPRKKGQTKAPAVPVLKKNVSKKTVIVKDTSSVNESSDQDSDDDTKDDKYFSVSEEESDLEENEALEQDEQDEQDVCHPEKEDSSESSDDEEAISQSIRALDRIDLLSAKKIPHKGNTSETPKNTPEESIADLLAKVDTKKINTLRAMSPRKNPKAISVSGKKAYGKK
jgi:hypothetical protein